MYLLVLLLLAPLLALSPLLHAHPKDAQGEDHPSGIHLPIHTDSDGFTENPCVSPGQSATAETPRLPTIVVPEIRRRDQVALFSADVPAVIVRVLPSVFVSRPARVALPAADAPAPVPSTLWFAYRPLAPPHRA
jgi:hypothetical protein